MNKSILFVAELSANHNGSFDRAKKLVEAAAASGAGAIKLQTYTPDSMTLNVQSFKVSEDHALWGNKKLYDLYAEAMTPWEWHAELFNLARSRNIQAFSSPFDRRAVDFLEDLNCPIYKIASLETSDVDLIAYAASTKKPLIISTGATELREIREAVDAAIKAGCQDLTLLLCTSSYPAEANEAHLARMATLREEFGMNVGLSDHTLGLGVSIAAIALGATVIEKHLTLDRSEGGHDSSFSMEPHEYAQLVIEGNNASEAIGSSDWRIQDSEKESRRLRRSLFIATDVKKGEMATRENIKALRPNYGGPIEDLPKIIGKKFKEDFIAGQRASIECVY